MTDSHDRRESRKRRRREREASEAEERRREEETLDEVLLSPQERALRHARREAERRVEFTGDMVSFVLIASALLIFAMPLGIIYLVIRRDKLRGLYRALVEPKLREKFLREQVEQQVHAHLSHERQTLEGRHSRSMEELSASIAHEIRNPITAAKSLVQQMEEEPSAKENTEYARVALEELTRVERSVSHLLRFARDEEMRVQPVCLSDVVESALETFRDRISRNGIELCRRFDAEGELQGDAEKLRRVVINLVGNALDSLEESRTEKPRIEVHVGENLAGTEVWLRVADNGPGIDGEILEKMFSPFYTSKANGTGLGLSICKKLVDAHGGLIEANDDASGGAEFLLSFPKLLHSDGAIR